MSNKNWESSSDGQKWPRNLKNNGQPGTMRPNEIEERQRETTTMGEGTRLTGKKGEILRDTYTAAHTYSRTRDKQCILSGKNANNTRIQTTYVIAFRALSVSLRFQPRYIQCNDVLQRFLFSCQRAVYIALAVPLTDLRTRRSDQKTRELFVTSLAEYYLHADSISHCSFNIIPSDESNK